MTQNSYFIIIYFFVVISFITFLFSLRTLGYNNAPAYMNGFYLYNLVGFLAACGMWAIPNFFIVNNVLILFNYGFLGYFFLKITGKHKNINAVSLIYIFFFIVTIFLLIPNLKGYPMAKSVSAISNLGELSLIGYYFYSILGIKNELDMRREPAFWIALGVFIYLVLVIPMALFDDFLRVKLAASRFYLLSLIYPFAILILQLFFIRAFIVTKKLVN